MAPSEAISSLLKTSFCIFLSSSSYLRSLHSPWNLSTVSKLAKQVIRKDTNKGIILSVAD